MHIVLGELDVGVRMAVQAGGQNPFFRNVGQGIGCRQDLVGRMTIPAEGHVLQIAQVDNLPVVGVEVSAPVIRVALAALVQGGFLKFIGIALLDLMGPVATQAIRRRSGIGRKDLGVDRFLVSLRLLGMTDPAVNLPGLILGMIRGDSGMAAGAGKVPMNGLEIILLLHEKGLGFTAPEVLFQFLIPVAGETIRRFLRPDSQGQKEG